MKGRAAKHGQRDADIVQQRAANGKAEFARLAPHTLPAIGHPVAKLAAITGPARCGK
jgi:hypothetical protein